MRKEMNPFSLLFGGVSDLVHIEVVFIYYCSKEKVVT
jgi:hypothetical protein